MAEVDSMISVTGGALGDSGCAQVETVTARILSHFRIRALVFLVTALTLAASQLVWHKYLNMFGAFVEEAENDSLLAEYRHILEPLFDDIYIFYIL